MWKARIAAQTASSWHVQPASWNTIASAAAAGLRMTPSPLRAIVSRRLTGPSESSAERSCRRALTIANNSRSRPSAMTISRLVTAQVGIFAATRT